MNKFEQAARDFMQFDAALRDLPKIEECTAVVTPELEVGDTGVPRCRDSPAAASRRSLDCFRLAV